MIALSVGDILIVSALAISGLAMHPLPIAAIAYTLFAALLFAFVLDTIKAPFPEAADCVEGGAALFV